MTNNDEPNLTTAVINVRREHEAAVEKAASPDVAGEPQAPPESDTNAPPDPIP